MSDFSVRKIREVQDADRLWDDFVLNKSMNGTFLHTRKFLNYHPQERFFDDSIFIFDNMKIVAVFPACKIHGDTWFSHSGSTFGGPVISTKYYNAKSVLEIIETIEHFCKDSGYKRIILKPTNSIFSRRETDLLDYLLNYKKYASFTELTTYVDLEGCPNDVIESFDRNKCRNIIKCQKYNLEFKRIYERKDKYAFYALLCKNLEKYRLKPIHTIGDIIDLSENRFPDNIRFYGVFEKDIMRAAGMLFTFPETHVIHAQNLSSDYEFDEYSPITFLYYKVVEEAKKEGFLKLSWGISTEDRGRVLNESLLRNKESYGSRYCVNHIFEKELL